jgi:radical SAM superfamily enzyme YgiQ (UPF0313 family)
MSITSERIPRILLVGPYDPFCGEYTFLAPPLGVWRLAGVLSAAGVRAEVFDPNCCNANPQVALEVLLDSEPWDVVGISTTGMTLRFDLQLAHAARRACPHALLLAGGMEATFKPALMFELAPFDGVVLGEGELPLLQLAERLRHGQGCGGIPGIAERRADGSLLRINQPALSREQLREAIFQIPYERMPYRRYWERLERAYSVGAVPSKAAREASLAEIHSVRLITLNYCPMACSFCSATNFLHEAQGEVASIARLSAQDCLQMIERVVAAHPDVRTVIFQDDIFAFTQDRRLLPLCEGILEAKQTGRLPRGLQFISTNRIDAMNLERLTAMRRAGFRVLGFGIESFSQRVLQEFNKGHIQRFIAPVLRAALDLGITPFLDLILTSPHCRLADLAETLSEASLWLRQGCEIGMYPYVIPFSGAALANDVTLQPHTTYVHQEIAGTTVSFQQAGRILPLDSVVREVILRIERDFESLLAALTPQVPHLPSRVRSVLWLLAAVPVMAQHGYIVGDARELGAHLASLLPRAPGMPANRRASAPQSLATA